MLLVKGRITQDMISLLDKWRYTGFKVFSGPRILPRYEKSLENLARYIIRASFSQERMTYHRKSGQVGYQSKDEKETRVFDALEWLTAMCSHVPSKGEQMTCYYGYYSNVSALFDDSKQRLSQSPFYVVQWQAVPGFMICLLLKKRLLIL